MKWFALLLTLVVASLSFSVACSSEKKLGESCEESGKTEGECESGGVCGKNTGDALVCLKVCAAQTDCAAAEDCNGVDGTSTKGCRLKSTTGSSGGTSGADAGKK
jgi:hypothetical protein